ncbi:hypothetical protein OIDMADRAFT_104734 [Oidiodendron maius Zn]|uniref:CENP-V/GFA domain-containing protein n=1 Tax=Oidiodendron maius (strain Zn) TaxID=913774 RepID=A0A0C3H9T8_OIDMZ|nr:hypothetical protein OIDMADRAFT_104734 [Oidiodendron maius Zn]
MTSTSSAHLTCLCGAISEPGTLLSDSKIPITIEICHCNPCRYATGALGAVFPPLKASPSQDTLSKVTPYHSSQKNIRYFCSTCGSHCFVENQKNNEWFCLSGIIEQSPASRADNTQWPKDIIKVSRHDYVLDTVDGGLVPIMLDLHGRTIPTWSLAAQEIDSFDLPHADVLFLASKAMSTIPSPKEGSNLPAKCHCGGVSLLIKRANYASNPGTSTHHNSSDDTKYRASPCACRSCRLSTGVSMLPWTTIPTANVSNANASNVSEDKFVPVVVGHSASSPDANSGLTLKHYWSSPERCWSFCGKCGATIFYWSPDHLDVAVGILRAEEGSMARRWLEWEWGHILCT